MPKILSVKGNGAKVEFLTTDRVLSKFYARFIKGEKSKCALASTRHPSPLAMGARPNLSSFTAEQQGGCDCRAA